MDIIKILSGLKGKVLDAANYELLKQTYDLQNSNIEQLKENNRLLQDKVKRIEKENKSLKNSLEQLRKQIPSPSDSSCLSNLSNVARDILKLYLSCDETDMFVDEMVERLRQSQIKVEAALNELEEAGILEWYGGQIGRGPSYCLTDSGTKYLADGLLC